jgi:hypothetical protein
LRQLFLVYFSLNKHLPSRKRQKAALPLAFSFYTARIAFFFVIIVRVATK